MCKLNLSILYIRTCQNENLFPTFVRFRVAIPRLTDSKVVRQCRNSILQDKLKFKRHLLRQTTKHMALLDQELKEAVPHMIYVRLTSISTEIVNKKLVEIQDSHKEKLDNLRAKYSSYTPQRQTDLDPVKNLSRYTLSEAEHNALLNGLTHVYAPEKFDQPQFVCDMEYFYSRLLNFKIPYRHYESKPAYFNVCHSLTPSELNTASELRQTANLFQKAAQSEMKRVGKANRENVCCFTFTSKKQVNCDQST